MQTAKTGKRTQDILARLDAYYARQAMRSLVELGQHKMAGTDREHEAARWLQQEMERIGLADVRMEPVQVVASDLAKGGTIELLLQDPITIEGLPPESSWPTPEDGLEGDLVYVGGGTPAEITQDITGKIVIFRRRWPDSGVGGLHRSAVAAELWSRGAIGIACFEEAGPPDAVRLQNMRLAGSGIEIPMLSISRQDAHRLIAAVQDGQGARARLTCRHDKPHDRVSYNVVGAIPGSRRPSEYIIIASHYDTWFHGAADTLSGVGCVLGIAKAMKEIGFQPDRTILFVAHGAEEQGLPVWNNWLIGSFSLIHLTHADWQGHVVAELNIDVVYHHPDYAMVEVAPELLQAVRDAADEAGITNARIIESPSPSILMLETDAGAYLTAGVPAADITFSTPEYWDYYHTIYDSTSMVTEASLDWTMRLWASAAARLSTNPALALSVGDAMRGLSSALEEDVIHLASAGVPTARMRKTIEAIRATEGSARVLERLATSVAARNPVTASEKEALDSSNRIVLECLRQINSELRIIGDPIVERIYYAPDPYAHDAGRIGAAISALKQGDLGRAIEELAQVYAILAAGNMSPQAHEVFMRQAVSNVGAWARHAQRCVDVYSEWVNLREAANSGKLPEANAIAGALETHLTTTLEDLNGALDEVLRVAGSCKELLARATDEIESQVHRPGAVDVPGLAGIKEGE